MKPLRLALHAFGPYPNGQEIDFERLGAQGLFLIHGPTGSGKSTVLDAMTYALFDSKKVERAGADFVSTLNQDDVTSVTLDFEVRGARYRASRRPAQRRAKKRGAGHTEIGAEGRLERLGPDGTPIEVLADKAGDTTEAIKELLGCTAEQFRQTVVLPQGAFREVVTDDRTRREVLSRVFATERFARLTAKLKDAASSLAKQAETFQERRRHVFEKAGVERRDQLEAAATVAAEARAKAQTHRAEQDEARTRAGAAVDAAKALLGRFEARSVAQAKLATLHERAEAVESKRIRLQAGRRAARALDLRVQRDGARESLGRATRARDDTATELGKARETHRLATEAAEREAVRDPERDRADAHLQRLDALKEDVAAVADLRTQRDAKLRAAEEADTEAATRTEAVAGLDVERSALTEERDGLATQAAEVDDLADASTAAEARAKALTTVLEEERTIADQEAVAAELERAPDDPAGDRTLMDLLREHAAGLVAHELRDGEPCPVCGSDHHPSAHAPGDLAAMQETLARYREVEDRIVAARTLVREAQSRRDALLDAHDWRDARPELETVRAEAASLDERLTAARKARTRLGEIDARLSAIAKERETKAGEAADHARHAATSRAEAGGLDERIAAVHAKLPEKLRDPQAFADALHTAREAASRLHAAHEAATKALDEAQKKVETVAARLEEREAAVVQAQKDLDAAGARLSERLAEEGFADEDALRAAEIAPDQLTALERTVNAYDRDRADAESRVHDLDAELDGKEPPDLPALEALRGEAVEAWKAADADYLEKEGRHKELAGLVRELYEAEAHYGSLQERLIATQKLSALARGRLTGRAKIDFVTFVLQSVFGSVLEIGNEHLRRMTGGRYALHLVDDATQATSHGLELEVADHHAGGARRPAKTLSGGEGFLAALALALGLSESARRSSGGIELGALFVDEGFGSLDDGALDKVVDILRNLPALEGRTVGVISHVAELKRRIPTQLLIELREEGSRAVMRVNE